MTKHVNIRVHGLVQGVFYRSVADEKARALGLKGFVRNEPDGTVYIEAEGEEHVIDEFIGWCYIGSPAAKVDEVKVSEGPVSGFQDFRINE